MESDELDSVINPWFWFVLDLNPEPWAIGDLSVGRKNGRVFPMVGRNQQLFNYKEAVREQIREQMPEELWFEGAVELRMFFWRRRDAYKTPQARTHRKHEADGTNLAKATEDALQTVLFKNDKDVSHLSWWLMEQSEFTSPKVVIAIRHAVMEYSFPDEVRAFMDDFDEAWK